MTTTAATAIDSKKPNTKQELIATARSLTPNRNLSPPTSSS